jgi:hypothetical protein
VEFSTNDDGSKLLWATCNVGADKPEESGNLTTWSKAGLDHGYSSTLDSIVVTPTYRVPTMTDWNILYTNSEYTFETVNGVRGIRFTFSDKHGTRYNVGESIFIPAAGADTDNPNRLGCYWSSDIDSNWSDGSKSISVFRWTSETLSSKNVDGSAVSSDTQLLPTRMICEIPAQPDNRAKPFKLGTPVSATENTYVLWDLPSAI